MLSRIAPPVDTQIEELHNSDAIIEDKEKRYELNARFHRSRNEEKLMLGRGGAFCILCSYSDNDAVSVEQIQEGFEMENVEGLEEDGEVSNRFYKCMYHCSVISSSPCSPIVNLPNKLRHIYILCVKRAAASLSLMYSTTSSMKAFCATIPIHLKLCGWSCLDRFNARQTTSTCCAVVFP